MKPVIIGQDYLITLEDKNKELISIKNKIKLEGVLIDGETGKSLDKNVTIEKILETENHDGIDVKYFPEARRGWAEIKEIKIRLTGFALQQIESLKHFGTRYDGTNMIEIYVR